MRILSGAVPLEAGAHRGGRVNPPLGAWMSRETSRLSCPNGTRFARSSSATASGSRCVGSSIESTKTSRRGENGTKRIVTRIVRKTTTLTRGEERSVAEDLTKRAHQKYLQDAGSSAAITRRASTKPKTVRVSTSPRVISRQAPLVSRYS